MFRTSISSIGAWTDVRFQDFFQNISQIDILDDRVMTATANALFYPRLKDGQQVKLVWGSPDVMSYGLRRANDRKNDFTLMWLYSRTQEQAASAITGIESAINGDTDNHWAVDEDVSGFLSKPFDGSKVYVREDRHAAIMYIKADSRIQAVAALHLSAAVLPAIFKEPFDEKPLTDDERDMLHTLIHTDRRKYVDAMKKLALKYDFEKQWRDKALRDFEQTFSEKALQLSERNMNAAKNDMDSLESRFRDAIAQYRRAVMRYEADLLAKQKRKSSTEIYDYISENPDIHVVDIYETHLQFVITGYLDNWDADIWEDFADNGGIFESLEGLDNSSAFGNIEARKTFLDHIFSQTADYRIRMCAYYDLDYMSGVRVSRSYNYQDFEDYIPNPHLQYHQCLGDNAARINRCVSEGNFISAIEACRMSMRSLNVEEVSVTFRPFLEELMRSTHRIIEGPDGQLYTPEEALKKMQEADA